MFSYLLLAPVYLYLKPLLKFFPQVRQLKDKFYLSVNKNKLLVSLSPKDFLKNLDRKFTAMRKELCRNTRNNTYKNVQLSKLLNEYQQKTIKISNYFQKIDGNSRATIFVA